MKSFLHSDRPIVTTILAAANEWDTPAEIARAVEKGTDAFLLSIETMKREQRTPRVFSALLAAMGDKPCCVTCYRRGDVEDETEERRCELLLSALDCGAVMADVRADLFDPRDGEFSTDEAAVEKQTAFVRLIHEKGKEAVMSSHTFFGGVCRFVPKEEVLRIAAEQQKRGADIAKIVTGADTEEELLECFEAQLLCKKQIDIPVLLLCVGRRAMRHRLAGGLIYEPIVFVKEADAEPPYTATQPPLAVMVGLLNNAAPLS
ncbi:MAG: type I 3-dehydroquinate dehydratase [Clostridia bacterium]|nr:type I 3-dehydroquinate dehydratase [Clostridia bacterium]